MMRSKCKNFLEDAQQLWKRIVFNFLINNVDDHLQNIGFLYVGNNQWKLAPAFDLNPFPDKERESKTWLTEDTGPVTSLAQLLGQAERFQLSQTAAQNILEKVTQAVSQWKSVAASAEVGMTNSDIADFKAAFSV